MNSLLDTLIDPRKRTIHFNPITSYPHFIRKNIIFIPIFISSSSHPHVVSESDITPVSLLLVISPLCAFDSKISTFNICFFDFVLEYKCNNALLLHFQKD